MSTKTLIILLFLFFLVSCEKIPGDKAWVYFNETQCANPWPIDNSASTESKVQAYLETNGIQIFDNRIEIFSKGPFCEACHCSTGRKIYVLILKSDLEDILKLGFKK